MLMTMLMTVLILPCAFPVNDMLLMLCGRGRSARHRGRHNPQHQCVVIAVSLT
jgi:hypothetical protein